MEILIFILLSAGIIWYSLPYLRNPRVHGFYRFFAFEAILGLLLLNLRGWFRDPFSAHQIISWILLAGSLFLVIHALSLIHRIGQPQGSFEQTTRLVKMGAYTYIRHPMYASLLYFAWGVFFKSPSLLDGMIATVASAFLYTTGRVEEAENLEKFGAEYSDYMKGTRMFIPFTF